MQNKNSSIVNSSLFEKKKAYDRLIKESTLTKEFYFLLIVASFLAASGIVVDNVAVVIGAMLIAPLLSSFLVIGLGFVVSKMDIVLRKTVTTSKAIGVAVITAFFSKFILNFGEIDRQLLIKENFVEYLFISFAAGLIGTYIWVRSDLQSIAPGVLVAVTIIPPVASLGLGLSLFDREIINNAFLFIMVNSFGLLAGSIIMFSLFGFGKEFESIEKIAEKKIEE